MSRSDLHAADPQRKGRRRWAFNERFIIGKQDNPMLERWRLVQTPWFGVYVHFIFREDLDRVPHDHPWRFTSLVLRGGYTEQLFERPGNERSRMIFRRARRLHHFPLHHAHRIVSVRPNTVTLCVVGRKVRTWGFYDHGRWVDYRDMLGLRPPIGYTPALVERRGLRRLAGPTPEPPPLRSGWGN